LEDDEPRESRVGRDVFFERNLQRFQYHFFDDSESVTTATNLSAWHLSQKVNLFPGLFILLIREKIDRGWWIISVFWVNLVFALFLD